MIEDKSCPVLFEDFMFLMSFFVCLTVMYGILNFDFGFFMSCSSIWMCVMLLEVNLLLIVLILFMKCSFAMLAIFLTDVITLFACKICLGGVLVLVFVSSLTVVHNLLILLTSCLIFAVLVVLLLFVLIAFALPLILFYRLISCLFFTVSFCE